MAIAAWNGKRNKLIIFKRGGGVAGVAINGPKPKRNNSLINQNYGDINGALKAVRTAKLTAAVISGVQALCGEKPAAMAWRRMQLKPGGAVGPAAVAAADGGRGSRNRQIAANSYKRIVSGGRAIPNVKAAYQAGKPGQKP